MMLERPITDGIVTLATLDESTADGPYLEWMHNAEITQYLEIRFQNCDREKLEGFIHNVNASKSTLLVGIFLEQRHVGNIKLDIDQHHMRGDLGIMIGDRSVWGRGIARRAIALLSDFAFRNLSVAKLCAGCYANNIGSRKAFEAVGFAIEAVRRRHFIEGDRRVDAVYLSRFSPSLEASR